MSFYPDLGPCDYLGPEHASGLKAIGWLEEDSPYRRDKTDPRFVHKLVLLLAEPWEHERLTDPHYCSLCTFSHGPVEFRLWQSPGMPTVPMGSRNLFVPGAGFLYITPSLVLHYIDAHHYAPPEEFVKAVLECPPTRSKDYLNAVQANAPKGFLIPR
jgi:hypothetical protein